MHAAQRQYHRIALMRDLAMAQALLWAVDHSLRGYPGTDQAWHVSLGKIIARLDEIRGLL